MTDPVAGPSRPGRTWMGRPGRVVGLLVISLASFVMLGLADGSLGVAWPTMRGVFDRSLSDLGMVIASGSVGYLVASTTYGRIHAIWGTGTSLGAGCTLMALALGGIALSPEWAPLVVFAMILGVGGGLVDAGMNSHAALEFNVGSMNLLHASYGLGAIVGPFLITVSIDSGAAWRGGYAVLAATQVVIAALVWLRRGSWVADAREVGSDVDYVLGRRRMVVLLLLFMVYTGVEVGAGQWAFTLLNEGRGMSTTVAGRWVAAYWAGLTVGRFLIGFLGRRLRPSRVLDGSLLVALTGIGIVWLDPSGLGAAGLPLTGLGFAAMFPTLVLLTPLRIGRLHSTRMVGYQLAAASVGTATIPWLLGLIAEDVGIEGLGPSLFAATVMLGALHLWSDRRP